MTNRPGENIEPNVKSPGYFTESLACCLRGLSVLENSWTSSFRNLEVQPMSVGYLVTVTAPEILDVVRNLTLHFMVTRRKASHKRHSGSKRISCKLTWIQTNTTLDGISTIHNKGIKTGWNLNEAVRHRVITQGPAQRENSLIHIFKCL